VSLSDIIQRVTAQWAIRGSTGQKSSKFLKPVARAEATPLRELRAVRNADDWPVRPQIGWMVAFRV